MLLALSVSSRKSCANLIVILAIVTAAATRLAFFLFTRPGRSLRKGWAMSPPRLGSSCKHTCKPRQCMFIKPKFPSHGLQLLVWTRFADKLSSSVSCIIAVRRRRVSAMFLAVSTRQEGRNVDDLFCTLECGSGGSRRGRGYWTSPSLNLNVFGLQASLSSSL